MKIIAILLYIYLVSGSSCPNACSGHGICTTSGVCVCNRQTGLALNNGDSNSFTYTGADCSQRTCPNGYSFNTPWDLSTPIYPPTVPDPRTRALEEDEIDISIEESSLDDVYEVKGGNYSINPEGGTLQCSSQRTKKPLGIATVLTMKKVTANGTEVNTYYVRYDFTDDPSPDNYTCTAASQRNDLSLFKPTKVKLVGKDYYIIYNNTKFIFDIMNWTLQSKETVDSGEEIEENNVKEDETNIKQMFACYSGKDPLIQFYPINSIENKGSDIIFDIGRDLEEIEDNSTCHLLTKADGTPVKMSDSDFSKLCRKDIETGNWYYGLIDLSSLNDNNNKVVSGKSQEGNYVLGVTETVSNEMKDLIYNDSKLFVPLPQNDVNSASISNIIIEGTLVSVSIVYNDSDISVQRVRLMGIQSNSFLDTNNKVINRLLLEEIEEEVDNNNKDKNNKNQNNQNNNQPPKKIVKKIRKRKLQTQQQQQSSQQQQQKSTEDENKISGVFTKTLPEISIKPNIAVQLILIELINNPKDATHVFMECSGQGMCNRDTGECECYPGYDGEACQRLSCPNNCNGNGRCVRMTEGLLNNDASTKYFGFGSADVNGDKVYVCLCDPGKRGPDCSMIECPSTEDPQKATNLASGIDSEFRDCSGRGICDYNNGICNCFKGYYGEACQKMIEVQ